jgi:transcriptional regulator of NAD metabolism
METGERRRQILELLTSLCQPITGSALAARFDVTRQVIVQDVAVLRAQGLNVLSTPKGYIMLRDEPVGITRILAVKHKRSETGKELYAMVDSKVEVLDVIVDHPVYGQLTGQLSLSSRNDVDSFLRTIENTNAGLLSSLTDGVHLHTVRSPNRQNLENLLSALRDMNFLLEE